MTGEPHGEQAGHGRDGEERDGEGRDGEGFTELHSEVDGISHKMLTQNLRLLERDGLVERTVYPTVPPRVEYTLTEPGQALRATVDAMCDWTRRHLRAIETAPHRFDAARPA
ncbi:MULTISPECIES: winged helix-turn-helix transcriptional regulator [unclassified Streptomyces]|uniref:winged helix-turn-helix transcriptional regulator n=1 Tax=unclassified Streptomyces TaxID=2593676 RepID=UPI000995E973|nr:MULTISPECIES: helix-turn-helix domain-containing protein [unclassified Streptomyces]